MTVALLAVAVIASAIAVVRGLRVTDPFLDPRLFRSVPFSSAALVSLLTGYAFATAIIGGAVFVDRVLYGGPDDQRLALGALAGATALGALASGFVVRVVPLSLVALAGIGLSIVGLVLMSRWTPAIGLDAVALGLGVYGFGFGLTVTPRSTAAVESAGRRAFGTASAVVTVARMLGMAVGLAILTAYGSTTIDRLYDEVYATPDAYLQFIPESLRDRPLRDPLVVGALEEWASREAASIMVGLFVVAAGGHRRGHPAGPRPGRSRGAAGRVCWTAHRPRAARPRGPPLKDPTPMASTPPNPASPSDADPEIPLGVRVQRQRATGPAGPAGHDPGRRGRGRDGPTSSRGRSRAGEASRSCSASPTPRSGSISSLRPRPRRSRSARRSGSIR